MFHKTVPKLGAVTGRKTASDRNLQTEENIYKSFDPYSVVTRFTNLTHSSFSSTSFHLTNIEHIILNIAFMRLNFDLCDSLCFMWIATTFTETLTINQEKKCKFLLSA